MTDKTSILYVDDEENNLNSFRAQFRKQYEVFTAVNAKDAFRVLEKNKIHIIISDQRMPQTTGVEFLEKTIEKYPDSMRLLITAYADIDIVIEAINRGQINKFIQKPWDWEKLSLAIENCAISYKSKIELRQKNEQLQKVNDELNKFVYSVSHDLRAPLMSILGLVQISKKERQSKIIESYFENIKTSVIKLDTFIINIIDYYKNSHPGEIKSNINFKELVLNIQDSLKNLDPNVVIESEIQQTGIFRNDLFRLEIILKNLISNAIKYQNPNNRNQRVKIEINSTSKEACIIISDNGIGIAQEHLQNIFNLFFRVGNSTQKEGTGIGLYIVKEAVEKIKGTLTFKSTPLVGSLFQIIIPNDLIEEKEVIQI
jgi:two-component system sensor histidine kinase/response regulator